MMHPQSYKITLDSYLLKNFLRICQKDKYKFKSNKIYGINFLFLLSVCFLFPLTLQSQQIREITSYQEFPWQELGAKDIDPRIFMFDIDYTVTRTDILRTAWTAITSQPYESFTQLWSYLSTGEKKGVRDLGIRYEKSSLIEESIPYMIDSIIENGHIVWNFTNVSTGKLYDTTYEERMAYKLNTVNIKRSPILSDEGEVERVDFPAYKGAYPVFYKGILLNAKRNKTEIFEHSFLPWLQSNPSYQSISHILYFDDDPRHVGRIGEICKCYKFNYDGFICRFT